MDQRGGADTDESGAAATEHPVGRGADVLQGAVGAHEDEDISGLSEECMGSRLVAMDAGADVLQRAARATFVEPEDRGGHEHAGEEAGCDREPRRHAHIRTGIGALGRRPEP